MDPAEPDSQTMLIVDTSVSMAYRGRQALSKFEYARQVAASLAKRHLGLLEAVGLLTHGDKPREYVPPRGDSKQWLRISQTLERTEVGGESSLGEMWNLISEQHLKRPGVAILISDCFDGIEPLTCAIWRMHARSQKVILFRILAQEEVEFPFDKLTKFRNLEVPGNHRMVDARRMREEYLKNFTEHAAQLRRLAGDLRIDFRTLRTDEPVERAL